MTSFEIVLRRPDRIYMPGEVVSGDIVIQCSSSMSHQGISLRMEGSVQLQLSAKSVGLFEAFYNSIKPVQLVLDTCQVTKAGKVPAGETKLPFEFKLEPLPGQNLYETYHGVFVSIQYMLTAEMPRGMLAKNQTANLEFIVEKEPVIMQELNNAEPVPFEITPKSLENVKKGSLKDIPNFKIVGSLDRATTDVTQPFTGRMTVVSCDSPIQSIELQLVRVETCGCVDGYAKEATEIQNIQIADGDVLRGLEIPIFMVLPRLFTAPTLAARTFKIEFEVNLVVMFPDKRLVTWNFPIRLVRAQTPPEHRLYV